MKGLFLILTFSLSAQLWGKSSFSSISFQHFDEDAGLNQKTIHGIAEDKYGFIWIASQEGLSRFDGYQFQPITVASANNSATSNFAESIFIDSKNNLWIGTKFHGINRYELETNELHTYDYPGDDTNSGADAWITTIYEDKKGTIWFGTREHGIAYFNDKESAVKRFSPFKDRRGVYAFADSVDDPKNYGFLVGTSGAFLNSDDHSKGQLIKVDQGAHEDSAANVIQSMNVQSMVSNAEGVFYIASGDRVYRAHADINQLETLFSVSGQISSLKIDTEDNLYIGTYGEGLYIYEQVTGKLTNYTHIPGVERSLSSDDITTLYIDSSRYLWLGTSVSGLNRISLDSLYLLVAENNILDTNSVSANYVSSVNSDQSGNLWIGTYGQGLDRYDFHGNKLASYNLDNGSISDDRISSIFVDSDNTVWVGTLGGGLNKYDPQNDGFVHVELADNRNALSYKKIQAITEFNDAIWIGTLGSGLARINVVGKSATLQSVDLATKNIWSLFVDGENHLWVGSDKGLLFYDQGSRTFRQFAHDESNRHSLSHNWVSSIAEHSPTMLLVGTYGGGINLFDKNDRTFRRIGMENGLSNNSVTAIVVDQNRKTWIATNNGVTIASDDINKFDYLYGDDGLQSNEFYLGSKHLTKEGGLYLGGLNGLSIVDTLNFRPKTEDGQVFVVDFLVSNKSVPIVSSIESVDFSLSKNIFAMDKVVLSHKERIFSFVFSSKNPGSKMDTYQYRLKNWSEEWLSPTRNSRVATFTNIPAGSYTFQLRKQIAPSSWGDIKTIDVEIKPAPWLTVWAILLYISLSIGVIFTIAYLYYKKLRSDIDNKLLLKDIDLSQKNLELIEKDKQHALAVVETKERLFANISHEFRTPLTLMLLPLDRLMTRASMTHEQQQIELIKRNAMRLLRMVEQILTLSQADSASENHHTNQDVQSSINGAFEIFYPFALSKGVALKLNETVDITVELTNDAINQVLANLLSNAIKYTPKGGEVAVSARVDHSLLVLQVSDTGVGIAKEDQARVFERFERVENQHPENGVQQGTGIGLSVVAELVRINHGSVSINSSPGQGSEFIVSLPIKKTSDHSVHEREPSADIFTQEVAIFDRNDQISLVKEGEASLSNDNFRRTILVIDDSADMRLLLQSHLQQHYQCLVAASGDEGVKLALEYVPDAIISDIMMPSMDGYEVTSYLREHEFTCHIPIILLTARGDYRSRIKGWKHASDDYLTKPFSMEELLLRVDNLIRIREIVSKRLRDSLACEAELKAIDKQGIGKKDKCFLEKFEQLVSENYPNSDFNRSVAARSLFMSERQLNRKLAALIDQNFTDFLRTYRLQKSRQLIIEGYTIAVIVEKVGFSSASYFSSCFKDKFKMTTRDYKKSIESNAKEQSIGVVVNQ